jgi:hypothetical protein
MDKIQKPRFCFLVFRNLVILNVIHRRQNPLNYNIIQIKYCFLVFRISDNDKVQKPSKSWLISIPPIFFQQPNWRRLTSPFVRVYLSLFSRVVLLSPFEVQQAT